MAMTVPFIKWISDDTFCHHARHGTHYYLIPIQGRRVLAAVSIRRRSGELYYKARHSFKQTYGETLHAGQDLEWSDRQHLAIWLRAMVHNSFIYCSIPVVPRSWFVKQIWEHELSHYMVVPSGLEPYLDTTRKSVWILLRHKSKAWPIQVINGRFQFAWKTFWTTHKLESNFRLIFSCERQWVFDVIVLDPHGNEVFYDWSFEQNHFFWHPTAHEAVTACSPSLLRNTAVLFKIGIYFVRATKYLQEIQDLVDPLYHHFRMDHINIKMGSRTWTISLGETGNLDAAAFHAFVPQLRLEPFDYIFVAVMPNVDIRVIVFDGVSYCERLYDWL